jgi:hypothetical protein
MNGGANACQAFEIVKYLWKNPNNNENNQNNQQMLR